MGLNFVCGNYWTQFLVYALEDMDFSFYQCWADILMFLITAGSSFKNISESENCWFQVWEDCKRTSGYEGSYLTSSPKDLRTVVLKLWTLWTVLITAKGLPVSDNCSTSLVSTSRCLLGGFVWSRCVSSFELFFLKWVCVCVCVCTFVGR